MNAILSIETSGTPSSVSFHSAGKTIEEIMIVEQKHNSSMLTYHIQQLLRQHLPIHKQLDAIVVNEGPGSYTGLRVGLSVAKGLAYSMNAGLYLIRAMKALANGFQQTNSNNLHPICVITNARRGKVFYEIFSPQGDTIQPVQRGLLTEVLSQFENNFVFITGADILAQENEQLLYHKLSATTLYNFGMQHTNQLIDYKDIAYAEPNYLINNYI